MMRLRRLVCLALPMILAACATPPDIDYSAFRASKPTSILVLPPTNASVEPEAVTAVLAQATRPLAESGYYVVPVAVMQETFLQNGLTEAGEIQTVDVARLREIFGVDTALYLHVEEYGSSYNVLSSKVTVTVSATLVDLRTGTQLWRGSKTMVDGHSSRRGGVFALLSAAVTQVVNTLSDTSYELTGKVNHALLSAGSADGLLYGPRSPHYGN